MQKIPAHNECQFLELFKKIFKGRTDVVPKYWEKTDPKSQKQKRGYSPIRSFNKALWYFPGLVFCFNFKKLSYFSSLLLNAFLTLL